MSPGREKSPIDWLSQTSPGDFDGHTGFESWTPEQKLAWLSEAAVFVFETSQGKSAHKETPQKRMASKREMF